MLNGSVTNSYFKLKWKRTFKCLLRSCRNFFGDGHAAEVEEGYGKNEEGERNGKFRLVTHLREGVWRILENATWVMTEHLVGGNVVKRNEEEAYYTDAKDSLPPDDFQWLNLNKKTLKLDVQKLWRCKIDVVVQFM